MLIMAAALMAGCNTRQAEQGTLSRAEMLREKILSGDTSSVLVAAHRGDWRFAPENSIAAIEHSIGTGVDVVELDLQLTRDSILIVMHDSKLDRTTTGKGRVSDWTMDSIRTLKLKNGASIRTKHSVPTLEEALIAVPDSYREGSFGLGAGKLRTVFRIILPSAMPGILSGIILGIGRIVGETAALMFTSGSVAKVAVNPADSGRTLAVHMYNLLNEGLAREAAYATAVVLLVLVVGINALSSFVAKKFTKA